MAQSGPITLPQVGENFEQRYQIGELLGEGGFARVHAATDLSSGARVALKFLKPDAGQGYDTQTRARFHREVRILAELQDPHTVQLLGYGESDRGMLYMAFELVAGRDLSEVLAAVGRLRPHLVVHVLRQVLQSLAEAHRRGLIHRDLKPENIRVYEANGDPMKVKLLDFGIARGTDDGHPAITNTGELIGTPRYMAPEQLLERPLSPASDVYSVGMVAMELLVGREALPGNSWGEQFERLVTGHVFSIPEMERAGLALMALLQRMTARDPSNRPANADAVLHSLSALSPAVSTPSVPAQAVEPPQPRVSGRYIVIGVVALVAVVALAVATVKRTKNEAAPVPVSLPESPVRVHVGKSMSTKPADGAGSISGCGRLWSNTAPHGMGGAMFYAPFKYDEEVRHPLVVVLHGDEHTRTQIIEDSLLRETADRERFVVAAPMDEASEAWRDAGPALDHIHRAIDRATETLCIDERRIFVIGHGSGGRRANDLSCDPRIRAVAFHDYVSRANSDDNSLSCEPAPAIWLTPKASKAVPMKGGPSCETTEEHDPIETTERAWRARNGVGKRPVVTRHNGGECTRWRGEAPFVSCHLDGGAGWTPESAWERCKEPPPGAFRSAERIWEFFEDVGADDGCGSEDPANPDGLVVHEPQNYDPNHRHPLVVALHADLQDRSDLISKTRLDDLADRHGFLVMAPREDTSNVPILTVRGPTVGNARTQAWRDEVESVNVVKRAVARVRAHYCVDRERIFVYGNGPGGKAASALTCEPWVRGVAVTSFLYHSAENPFTPCPETPKPALWLSPQDSPKLNIDGKDPDCHGKRRAPLKEIEKKWRERNHCRKERNATTHCQTWDCDAPFESCVVPGGDPFPGPSRCQKLNPRPSFEHGRHIWEFFERVANEDEP